MPSAAVLTSTQNEASVPRPTRPRSWWSWASPKRSAPSTTIIVASATSTPTSTTVVPTSTSRSPSRKRAISASRSTGLRRPWTRPDPQRREQRRQPLELGLGRGGPRRLHVLVGQVVVAGEAVGPSSSPPSAAVAAAPIRGHDHERPVPQRRLGPDAVPRALEVVRPADPRADRHAAGGWRPERRHVEVRVQDLAERARDRGRRHQQDVRRAAGRLGLERPALLHAEPVLLVHDGQREVGERHLVLEQRVRPDHDRRLPRRDRLGRVPPPLARQRAGQQRDRQAEVLEQRRERRVVLAREEVGRREHRRLAPGERRGGERPGGDRGLARPDVALDQAEHRDGTGEVRRGLVDRGPLVGGERHRLGRACARATPPAPSGCARRWRRPPGSRACAPGRVPGGARPCPAAARAARRAPGVAGRRRAPRRWSGSGRPRAPRRSAARPPRRGSPPGTYSG